MKRLTGTLVMAGLVLVVGSSRPVAGQASAAGEQDLVAALLVEVRGLRAAMERMAVAGPRVQLALGRLQLQEQRVNTLMRSHDEVKARIAAEEAQAAQLREQVARVEARALREIDPTAREQAEEEAAWAKSMLERVTKERQRLQAEEISVAQAVASEQSRWMDINAQLEELERELRTVK